CDLVPKQWKEGEIVLLHENKYISKIDSTCDIINAVNSHDATREILYIDTENHAPALIEQLVENTHLSVYRPTFDDDTLDMDYADLVISAIETAVKETQIRVFVVDSINRIAAASFGRNASPVHIMKKLVALQMRYGISLLVIAHTDSRSTREALQALANRDIYAKLKPRPLVKPQHTPNNGRDADLSRPHYQSDKQAQSPNNSPSDSSERSDNTHPDEIPDSLKLDEELYMNKSLPRWERRRMQKAYKKLQSMQPTQ
ncbi:MAG: AAA family ATPase, partial [Muribaculaceae bacterium]|nr:AAA family ATPase [Muribaculaceae bacterium]